MAESLGTAVLDLETNDKGLTRGLDKAEGHSKRSFAAIGGAAKVLAVGGIVGLGFAVKDLVGDYMDGEKAAAQTEAVLKSTGGSAGVTAEQVASLATAISLKSGIDDAAVQSGENMLLTFTNIRNEAGKGNDIFNQSTAILADMSAAMGTDMKTQAIQLGKALNDPVKGVTALTKVGVTFSDKQKETIKRLVETGRTADAQKVILAELRKEFGGSAEAAGKTLGGQLSILKMQLENAAAPIMAKLLPALTQFLSWLNANGPQIAAIFNTAFTLVAQAFRFVSDFIHAHLDQIRGVIQTFVQTAIIFWQRWGKTITQLTKLALKTIWDRVHLALNLVANIFRVVGALIRGDWGAAWKAVKQLAKDLLRDTLQVIRSTTTLFLAVMRHIGSVLWQGLKMGAAALVGQVRDLIVRAKDAVRNKAEAFLNAAKHIASRLWPGFKSGAASLGASIGEFIGDKAKAVSNKAQEFYNAALTLGGKIWDGIKAGVGDVAGWLAGLAREGVNRVIRLFNSVARIGRTHIGGTVPGFGFDIPLGPHVQLGPWSVGTDIGPYGFSIPELAEGGIVRATPGGTLLRAGEAGKDEAIVPLPRGGKMFGDVNVTFNETPADANPLAIASAISWKLRTVGV